MEETLEINSKVTDNSWLYCLAAITFKTDGSDHIKFGGGSDIQPKQTTTKTIHINPFSALNALNDIPD